MCLVFQTLLISASGSKKNWAQTVTGVLSSFWLSRRSCKQICYEEGKKEKKGMENPGIDPGTSRMQSGRSTIWANPPILSKGISKTKQKHNIRNVRSLHYFCQAISRSMVMFS